MKIRRPLFVVLLVLCTVISAVCAGGSALAAEPQDVESAKTYTASAAGISSEVAVTITVEDGVITAVDVDASGETAQYGAAAEAKLEKRLLKAGSADIDAVSGSTITSNAAKAAMQDCLDQMAADINGPKTYTASAAGISSQVTVTITVEDGVITAVDVDTSGETAQYGAAAEAKLEKRLLKASSADIDAVSGSTITSNAAKAAMQDCLDQMAADMDEEPDLEIMDESASEAAKVTGTGTYTASAAGISSQVTVTITVEDGVITAVDVDTSGETAQYGAAAEAKLEKRLFKAGSADIDAVSGSTITSNAAKAAMQDCLDQMAAGA